MISSSLYLLIVASKLTIVTSIHYVKPNNISSMNCGNHSCLTLDQYAKEKDKYFTSGSSFLFLSGNHSLQTQINLTDLSNITIKKLEQSRTAVKVICMAQVAFRCANVTSFEVKGLTFLLQSNEHIPASALVFYSCSKIIISTSLFQGSENVNKTSSWAIFSRNSNILMMGCLFNGNTGRNGGAIAAHKKSRITLIGNTFTRNKSNKFGGALYGSQSSIMFRERNTLVGNRANKGGAIYLLLSIENTNILNNSRGGIFINDSFVVLNGTNMVASNYNTAVTITCRNIPTCLAGL